MTEDTSTSKPLPPPNYPLGNPCRLQIPATPLSSPPRPPPPPLLPPPPPLLGHQLPNLPIPPPYALRHRAVNLLVNPPDNPRVNLHGNLLDNLHHNLPDNQLHSLPCDRVHLVCIISNWLEFLSRPPLAGCRCVTNFFLPLFFPPPS